ncbi:AC19-like protein [Orgyia pseudotsugata single capsid nuclopolyhedrovirus]|nr:AC19-like protein [Orgyia pseudotsugata single capsid nuclopolyhedrovirus]
MNINSRLIKSRRVAGRTPKLWNGLAISPQLFFSELKNLIALPTGNSTTPTPHNRHNQQLFYNVGRRLVLSCLSGERGTTFVALQTIFDSVIELEHLLFAKSRLLHFIVQFLVAHSDGDNLQCLVNLRLLDYFLTNYEHRLAQ